MTTCKLSDRDDWFIIWKSDKDSMIETMVKNMAADLENGYDYFGNSIKQQRETIDAYKRQFDAELDSFKAMDEKLVNRWCYYDLIKRGAV